MTTPKVEKALHPSQDNAPLLTVDGLRVEFRVRSRWARAVDDVSFSLSPGRTLAVLGESGSGKSAMARALMGVLPPAASRVTAGEIKLHGRDLLRMGYNERRATCGPQVAMVFQDALSALNPVLKVGYQVSEGCRIHNGLSRREARQRAVELLRLVGIPDPERRADLYPHQFSGGMRQRVMIATALAADPEILVADEPTTALDVTVQAQILELLGELQAQRNMSLMLITHDMGVVAGMADDILVMYAGRVMESGTAEDVYDHSAHPYTRALLASIPRKEQKGRPLPVIGGQPPDIGKLPPGCPFQTRCPMAAPICSSPLPSIEVSPGHVSTCHRALELRPR